MTADDVPTDPEQLSAYLMGWVDGAAGRPIPTYDPEPVEIDPETVEALERIRARLAAADAVVVPLRPRPCRPGRRRHAA
jgi:hypothetical protein